MPRKHMGTDTKVLLAQALLSKLREGKQLSKIPVRELTGFCGLDRQTFYYHFKNIYELAEYTYKHELSMIFEVEDLDEVYRLDWRLRIKRVLHAIEDNPTLRDTIVPALGEAPIRNGVMDIVKTSFDREIKPEFEKAGLPENEVAISTQLLAYTVQSLVIGWVSKEIDWPVETLVNELSLMLEDYLRGIRGRKEA